MTEEVLLEFQSNKTRGLKHVQTNTQQQSTREGGGEGGGKVLYFLNIKPAGDFIFNKLPQYVHTLHCAVNIVHHSFIESKKILSLSAAISTKVIS